MNIVKKYLDNNQYYTEVFKKTQIFLHHTVSSNAQSAIRWWNQTPDRVGCAYIIDRDGTIYEAFDPNNWAYALGLKGVKPTLEKTSIQIELVSWGQLQSDKDGYYVPLGLKKLYLKKEEVCSYNFRDCNFYQVYSEEQIKSLMELLTQLVKDHNIPINDLTNFWEFNQEVIDKNLPGIWAHTTVRKDKSDIFPYGPLVDALKKAFTVQKNVPKKDEKN
jgi:N-acetyl-anhydromuramyl-L-alanine amidase AmpD